MSKQRQSLPPVLDVDPEKCVNCHACIAACPVKYCNDASGDSVQINKDLCIGCGNCLKACTHDARIIIDDLDQFLEGLERGEKMVAISAPAVAASFPNRYLHLNGWLKSVGVEAVFDVSFGAELTVKTYLDYATKADPECIIAQPCPAIVSYIEIYKPELLPYLAPADSPMMHTIKMVKEFYPQYKDHKVVIISPCAAKKREFDEVGMGDYNVTMLNLDKYFESHGIDLSHYQPLDFDNPPAERAVLFSTPGGLKDTVERWAPNVSNATRKIEGVEIIYPYLDELKGMIDKGKAPLLVDCLNCEMGCNGGPGTLGKLKPVDEVEGLVEDRRKEMQRRHCQGKEVCSNEELQSSIEGTINDHWKEGLYGRSYVDRSGNIDYEVPSSVQVDSIYKGMHKYEDSDIKNCTACGYNACERMACAIHNDLNKKENCHFYNAKLLEEEETEQAVRLKDATQKFHDLVDEIKGSSNIFSAIDPIVEQINALAKRTNLLAVNATIQASHAGEKGASFNVVAKGVKELADQVKHEAEKIHPCSQEMYQRFEYVTNRVQEISNQIIEIIKGHHD